MRNAQLGKRASDDTRAQMSLSRTGERNGMFGKRHSKDALRKMQKPRGKCKNKADNITCNICGVSGAINNMHRYHFNNCKLNPINIK